MIEFYFIRHAESKDNLRGVWAGWKDSPLSNHGMQQAEALAASLSHVRFAAIYTSDLKRALSTAKVIHSKISCDAPPTASCPQIPLHVTSALREQNFGVGEGRKVVKKDKSLTLKAHYAQGMFPILYGRSEKFPAGESLEDVTIRAESFIEEVLTTLAEEEDCQKDLTRIVGVVSHGIFIAELVAALVRRDGAQVDRKNLRGMRNTAWTKVEVQFQPVIPTQSCDTSLHNVHMITQGTDTVSTPSSLKLEYSAKIVAINRHNHLSKLHRQKGIGSMAYDPNQQDLRKFFQVKPRLGSKKKSVKDEEKPK